MDGFKRPKISKGVKMKYKEFIAKKKQEWLNPNLFPYQIEIVKRGFIGSELKKSYFQIATQNIKEAIKSQNHLFGDEVVKYKQISR